MPCDSQIPFSEARVAIRRGSNPPQMARDALAEALDASRVAGKKVLLKPNCCYPTAAGTGVVTQPETVRGAIHYMKEAGAKEIWLGDGAIYGLDTDEALEKSGMARLAADEAIRLVNLDDCEPMRLEVPEPMAVESVLVSSLALEADFIISIPVMKCHMHAGVSLGLKNMKGCLWGRQKRDFHHLREKDRFAAWHDYKNIDRAIADLFSVLPPGAVLIDAVVGMEGLGPLLGQPKPLDMVLASGSPLAADLAGMAVMGLDFSQAAHIMLAARKQGKHAIGAEELNLDHEAFENAKSCFKPAQAEDLSLRYPQFELIEGRTCSACPATITAFLLTHGEEYADRLKTSLVFGKDLDSAAVPQGSVLFGNCAAAHRKKGEFVAGCPPVPSDLVRALDTLDKQKIME